MPTSQRTEEILSRTVCHAKLLLRSTITPQDYDTLFPSSSNPTVPTVPTHSILDVQRCLDEARASYEVRVGNASDPWRSVAPTTIGEPTSKGKAKVRVWLANLSETITHYGNIFDVLAQHHPEYVSLAWGTFKLLFVAIRNHTETASKLSKSISITADLLPQHSLLLILYPTPQMQVSVARLYAYILNFFVSALRWYKDSRAMHALKSIFQPWDLKFKEQYEAIASEAKQVRRLADIALKAELRDTRLDVREGTKQMEMVRREVCELRAQNQQLQDLFVSRFGMMENSMSMMYQDLRVDLRSQRTTLNRVHLTQMLSLPLWNAFPTSGESLQYCRSMRNRHRDRVPLALPDVQRLESWAAQSNSAILLIDTYIPTAAKTFMVDLIDLILDNGMPVAWALRFPDYLDQHMVATDIIRTLVLQAMQLGAENLLQGSFPVTVEQLQEAASLRDWIAILRRVLSVMQHLFITLDADLLAHATAHERSLALEMLDMLRSDLTCNVKIVLSISSVSRGYVEELEASNACLKIQTGGSDWRRSRKRNCRRERFRRR
ncbi:hypothetical protein DM02DRAFT_732948 [Periconia macrospinosa]|uniref:DUF7708 domain-containing protein n=1 Tax=Periconia macrospinosa TaxID=97972 RepID=A0A2V1D6N4_9PLEO|nr:hypothetical protein DM02DRAFT_732948 [Periconia macrospinosa]